jgi:hypothetical protein
VEAGRIVAAVKLARVMIGQAFDVGGQPSASPVSRSVLHLRHSSSQDRVRCQATPWACERSGEDLRDEVLRLAATEQLALAERKHFNRLRPPRERVSDALDPQQVGRPGPQEPSGPAVFVHVGLQRQDQAGGALGLVNHEQSVRMAGKKRHRVAARKSQSAGSSRVRTRPWPPETSGSKI